MQNMELYHILNRGVDGRTIFVDDQDRARFVHDLYEFNDTVPALQFSRVPQEANSHVGRQTSNMRERIVDIHGWKLMLDHYHLLVSERIENGLSLFLQKMSGYPRYFNERHGRHGPLFGGSTKKVPIEREGHFLYILHYVHLNALDDLPGAQQWRERHKGGIANLGAALAHLRSDRWSSYRDYCGIPNFPSILTKELYESRPGEYEASLRAYLADASSDGFEPLQFE